jgi:tetratricopeptide (TPR) repeat protein
MESKKVEFFNRLSFLTILATFFVSLFFFIPYIPVTLEASKGFLVSIGMTLALFFWLIARLGEGKFSIPRDRIILFAFFIPLAFLASSFFSYSKYISFFGSGFEVGTFGSMLVLFTMFFLSSIYFQTEKRLWLFFKSLFVGGVVVALFELLNIFIGFNRFLPGLIKGISNTNLIGSWNDFALFSGLIVVVSLLTIEFLKTKGPFLFMQYFLLVTGLFFVIIINFPLVWVILAVLSIITFVYSISTQQAGANIVHGNGGKKRFPFTALVVVFVSLIFLIGNNSIGGLVSKYIRLSNTEVRPRIETTAGIAWKAIKHNPPFGTGPNTFNIDWALWQPKEVAGSDYWSINFGSGYSALSTFLVTTGILGFLAWVLFLFTYFKRAVGALKKALENSLSNYFITTSLAISVYSWASIIFYTPNIVMYVLAFISSGIMIGILVSNNAIKTRTVSFLHDPRNSFFAILGLMVFMIATLSTTYIYAEKFASILYFSKGQTATSELNSLLKSERMLNNALLLDKNDIYYRTLSQIYIGEINALLNDKSISQDVLKSNIQQLVSSAEQSASQAVLQNPKQYINYINLANVYSSFVPLAVANSYDGASSAYTKARALAPNNPSVILGQASLEIINKNTDQARKYIDEALALKPDYTDAIFLLAQIEANSGNLPGAIKQAEKAATLNPRDTTVFFRLGLLRYNNSDYAGAVSAFEQSVILDPSYLNARYLLGESYKKVGRKDDALKQFQIIQTTLPDNQDVKDAIDALSSNAQAPVQDTKPTTNTKNPSKNTPAKAPLQGEH